MPRLRLNANPMPGDDEPDQTPDTVATSLPTWTRRRAVRRSEFPDDS